MSLVSIENARVEDDGAETVLGNANGNPAAKTEAQIATWAAHKALMGESAKVRDARENAVDAKADEAEAK